MRLSNANGINRLARAIQKRTKEVTSQPPVIDIATVDGSGGLRVDSFEITIPKEDVARIMVGEEKVTYKSGDRVVIAFAGDDIVVLGKLV